MSKLFSLPVGRLLTARPHIGVPMTVRRLDQVAIPVTEMDAMLASCTSIGFSVDDGLASHLFSVCQGDMKLNLHNPLLWQSGRFDLRGPTAFPGCGGICMVWDGSEAELDTILSSASIDVIDGPVERVGGNDVGSASGIPRFIRDPEDNLLEFIIDP